MACPGGLADGLETAMMRSGQRACRAAGAGAPCGKGLSDGWRGRSPMKCTVFRLVRGAGCPHLRTAWADRKRALTVRLHRVSTGVGAGMSTPQSVRSSLGGAKLTVEVHSASTECRRKISTRIHPRSDAHRRRPCPQCACRPDRTSPSRNRWERVESAHACLTAPIRLWIARPRATQNAVNFDGERPHVIPGRCRSRCG